MKAAMSLCLSDGPVPMPNMPNQIMNRMQVPQGMFLLIAFLAVPPKKERKAPHVVLWQNFQVLKFVNGLTPKCLKKKKHFHSEIGFSYP